MEFCYLYVWFAVYVKEELSFTWDVSLKNSEASCLYFRLALLHSVSYFFLLYQSPSFSSRTVLDDISYNIDEILSINPSANAFVFGDFNAVHKVFLTGTLYCDSHSPTLLDLFLSAGANICSTMALPPFETFDHVLS